MSYRDDQAALEERAKELAARLKELESKQAERQAASQLETEEAARLRRGLQDLEARLGGKVLPGAITSQRWSARALWGAGGLALLMSLGFLEVRQDELLSMGLSWGLLSVASAALFLWAMPRRHAASRWLWLRGLLAYGLLVGGFGFGVFCFDIDAALAGSLFIGLSVAELGFICASILLKEVVAQDVPQRPPRVWTTRRGARVSGAAVLLLWSALLLFLISILSMKRLTDDSMIVYGLFVLWALFSSYCSYAARRPAGAPALALTRGILAVPALFMVAAGALVIVLCEHNVRYLFYVSSGMLLVVELLYLYSGVALWISRKAPQDGPTPSSS